MINKERGVQGITTISADTYMSMVMDTMSRLFDILGDGDFESLQRLLEHVNLHFDQLIFENDVSADELESIHNVAQAVSAMMELRMLEAKSMM